MKITRYHEDLTKLHVNTLEPRAYFIPFASLESALSGDRNNSEYLLNLSGEWDFKYYPKHSRILIPRLPQRVSREMQSSR